MPQPTALLANYSEDKPLLEVESFLSSKKILYTLIGKALRQAFDEVIDGPRTGRYSIEELEKTEKTYIGTKVEIVLRNKLNLKRGSRLDNNICGHEVDTKFSLTNGWMIPREAIDQLCLLIGGNDKSGVFSVGLLRMTADKLTNGTNQDGKKSISAAGKKHIRWIIDSYPLPRNFVLDIPAEIRADILSKTSGVQRMRALFTSMTNQIIPRMAIEQVAQQKDALKRAREMKEILSHEGYKIVCATYTSDRKHFIDNGFLQFKDDDWLSIKIAHPC